MKIKLVGIFNTIKEWESVNPISDLVEETAASFCEKLFILNGKKIDPLDLINCNFNKEDELQVFLTPAGPLLIVGAALTVLSVAAAVVSKPNPSIPKIQPQQGFQTFATPGSSDRTALQTVQRSPVVRLTNRQNQTRFQGRVPEYYGTFLCVPDLITPLYSIFANGDQNVFYQLCLGVGNYQVNGEWRIGQTPLSRIERTQILNYGNGQQHSFQPIDTNTDGLSRFELKFNVFSPFFTSTTDDIYGFVFDVEFPQGLWGANADNGNVLVTFRLRFEIYTESGQFIGFQIFELKNAFIRNSAAYSVDTSQLLFSLSPGRYRIRFIKESNLQGVVAQPFDQAFLTRVAGRATPKRNRWPGYTTVQTAVLMNQLGIAIPNQRWNADVTRIIRRIVSPTSIGPAVPTNKWSDAMLEICSNQNSAGYADSQIDIEGLWNIQQGLESIGEGRFDALFDDRSTVVEEMETAAFAARVQFYKRGDKIFFVRDERKPFPVALFNARNKIEPEEITFSYDGTNDIDGVEITWANAANGYIPEQYVYPANSAKLNLLRLSLTGATSITPVRRRAQFEWFSRLMRQTLLKMRVAEEGRMLNLLDRILVSDGILELQEEGECLIDGRKIELDREVKANTGDFIHIRNINGGYHGSYQIQRLESNNVIFTVNSVSVDALPLDAQVYYLFAIETSDSVVNDWLVTSVTPDNDGTWNIEAIPYVDSLYNIDNDQLPNLNATN